MTVEACYAQFGGDYAETLRRLGKETLICRLLKRFLDDATMTQLDGALRAGDAKAAFGYAHTLKGVALNMGFTPLAKSSSDLAELLRRDTLEGAAPLYSAVEADYASIRSALHCAELS